MVLLSAIISIIGGLIAASSMIIAKKPNAQELIDKLVPFQGWIGVILLVFGIRGIVSSFMSIGSIGLAWGIGLGASLAGAIVGFLLAYGLITKYIVEKDENRRVEAEKIRSKLIKYQVPSGIVLIVLGVMALLF